MKSTLLIIAGIISAVAIVAITVGTIEYQSTYNKDCVSKGGKIIGFLSCFKIREDFAGPKIEGKMADEICSITGDQCPPYYIANIQEDGSKMVGITIWDADTKIEKQFVFMIKNETLSYTVTLKE